ncbi:hypothetical protein EGW08_020620, partial [Elysia chlorotica]
ESNEEGRYRRLEGYAIRTFRVAQNDDFLWFQTPIERDPDATLYDMFEVSARISPPTKSKSASPMVTLFRIESEKVNKRLEVCAYNSPYRGLTLRKPDTIADAYVGVKSAGGKFYKRKVQFPHPDQTLEVARQLHTFAHKCQASLRSGNGLTSLVALAQELDEEQLPYQLVQSCYDVVKTYLVSPKRHVGELKNAFYIQHMMFMSVDSDRPTESAIEYLENLDFTKRRIFNESLQTTEELYKFTR